MKKAAGFTLIELVIVIVILGILGAVAAPRFINLQDDAYAANINGLKGSIQSAMTLANTKAILKGQEKTDKATEVDVDGQKVTFVYGFPTADDKGIIAMLQDLNVSSAGSTDFRSIDGGDGEGATITIAPTARAKATAAATECKITYTAATSSAVATVSSDTTGC
ncbi:pilus assembly FimT family protein [Zobellella taiwanensis]